MGKKQSIMRRAALRSLIVHADPSRTYESADNLAGKLIRARLAGGDGWKEAVKKLLENLPGILKAVMAILALF